MNRIYQITRERRDEDAADDLPTGNPTVHIAQDRQKIKVFDEKPEETEIEDDEIYGVSQSQDILYTSNTVTEGDFNPVTSDAVYKKTEDIINTIKQYNREQNELSEWEEITLAYATVPSNPDSYVPTTGTTMEYDGFISVSRKFNSNQGGFIIFINNKTISTLNVYGASGSGSMESITQNFPVKKGDVVFIGESSAARARSDKAMFYKKRDYTGR